MTTNARWVLGGAVVAGVCALYTQLDAGTKEQVLGYVRGFTDKLPSEVKTLLPTVLLSTPSAVEKGVNKTVAKMNSMQAY